MNIGIDAITLTIPYPCGVKHYSQELLKNLAEVDKINNYYLFTTKEVSIPKKRNFHLIKLPYFPLFKHQLLLPFFARKFKLDVFHYLEPYGSVIPIHKKLVTTIHDIDLSTTYPWLSKQFFLRLSSEVTRFFVVGYSTLLITNSRYTKKQTESYLKQLPVKTKIIKVLPLAANPDFNKFNDNVGRYILCMGDFAVRKNIKRLILAYSMLPISYRERYNLKIICSTASSAKMFNDLASAYNCGKSIKVLENVDKKKLVDLYLHALVFVYPSIFEGFGIPILEAMSSGCPVITSNFGVMKETAGNAALLVNTRSTGLIKQSLIKIIKNSKLRTLLRKKGYLHAKKYSWAVNAKATLDIYKELHLNYK